MRIFRLYLFWFIFTNVYVMLHLSKENNENKILLVLVLNISELHY